MPDKTLPHPPAQSVTILLPAITGGEIVHINSGTNTGKSSTQ